MTIHTPTPPNAYEALRVARRHLRLCERAFIEHLVDEPMVWIDEIAKAEKRVTDARTRVHDVSE